MNDLPFDLPIHEVFADDYPTIAAAIGTQQPHIARIESGQADLRLETCRRIAEVLDVDLNTLDQALKYPGAKRR